MEEEFSDLLLSSFCFRGDGIKEITDACLWDRNAERVDENEFVQSVCVAGGKFDSDPSSE